jgi:hypothetical protein
LPLLSTVLFLLLFTGCGGKGGDATGEKSGLEQLAEAAENMKTAAEEMTAGQDREPQPPVSFKTLLTYLPAEIGGMPQSNPRGETSSMAEWKYSNASADYEGGETSARVEISDYAYINMLYAPVRMWLKMNISRESTEGFEHTVEVAGYPAYEKFQTNGKRGELTVLVGDRFIVNIHTNGLAEDAPRKVAEAMPLKKLAQEKAENAS